MTKQHISFIIKLSAFLVFFGRAWQHVFWDAPYRSFFWDESLLSPIIENLLGIPWQEYVTHSNTDRFIQNIILCNGILYLLAAIISLLINYKTFRWAKFPIFLGGISLLLLTILMTKEKFYHTAMFFEHSIQFGIPFVLLYWFQKHRNISKLKTFIKILIACTFVSHGLYAFGVYPVPGKFVDMVIQIFGCTEQNALIFLYIAGILDFVVAILIFIPQIEKYGLWYTIIWGLLTACARIVANFQIDFVVQSIHQNWFQTLFRLPHGLVPLISLFLIHHLDNKPDDKTLRNNKFSLFPRKKLPYQTMEVSGTKSVR